MKIKYIGNFRDGTDWAKACTYNALALHYAGYDVYCEAVSYNNQNIIIEQEIEYLLSKQTDDFDVVIQHVLPTNYRKIGGVRNIGVVELDTLTISDISWLKNLMLMDDIFVPNRGSKTVLERYGIKCNIFPYTFSFDKINNQEQIARIEEAKNTFNFYFAGEPSKRKNLETLLRAFHNEFDYIEPVSLIIRADNNSIEQIVSFADSVKANLKKTARYKKESIINGAAPLDISISLLKQAHCFIMPSYGEAWCYPAIEAMAAGLPLIYTKGLGIEDYSDGCSIAIASKPTFCYGATDTLPGLCTSEDVWLEIDVMELQAYMRKIFEIYSNENETFKSISQKSIENASKYDYKNCEFIKGIL